MATTLIEWMLNKDGTKGKVWNPITGCTKISDGCKNCYAEAIAKRFWGERKFSEIKCHPERLEQPLYWKKPNRIFVNSMSDLFHECVPFEFIGRVFDIIELSKRHTYIILTKRPERMMKYITQKANIDKPLNNIWFGVSVENQKTADERIFVLLEVPAKVRFVSVEPMLEGISLAGFDGIKYRPWLDYKKCKPMLDWVICGGESGPNARPMHPYWVRELRDQCKAANVPFFFKQWGEWALKQDDVHSKNYGVLTLDGIWHKNTTGWNGRPIDLDTGDAYMVRVGKKEAGCMLDGLTWDEFPKCKG